MTYMIDSCARKSCRISGIGLLLCMAIAGVASAQVRVAANKENVVASRLEGRWEPDSALTLRLGGPNGVYVPAAEA